MSNEQQKYTPALGYDVLTAYYDLAIKITMPETKFRQLLVQHIQPQPDEHILEFGFGTGQNLLQVHRQCPQVQLVGLDIDPKVKAIAEHKLHKNGIQLPLHLYDGQEFPFEASSFDKVFSCLVFHQLSADTKLHSLRALHRVLRPNGQLIIADWGKAQNRLMRVAFRLVQLLDGFKTTNDNVRGKLPGIIQQAGFRQVTVAESINTAIGTFSYFRAVK